MRVKSCTIRSNHQLVDALAENERYPLIFLTLEAPHLCANLLGSHLVPHEQQILKTSVKHGQSFPSSPHIQFGKNFSNKEYKKLQLLRSTI